MLQNVIICWRGLLTIHLQPGFVGGRVVGQPTAVSQALHHLEAVRRYITFTK